MGCVQDNGCCVCENIRRKQSGCKVYHQITLMTLINVNIEKRKLIRLVVR